jgi:three-Cys-motif partner protein
MPRRNIDLLFQEERQEWTKRKHDLLGRYVVPAAMKISLADGSRRVHLVDGYAGPNKYGGEVKGSTVIMIEAALKAKAQGRNVMVHACEVNPGRFDALSKNLAEHIQSGLLQIYNKTHADAVVKIQADVGNAPALVFLDPQTAAQMTLEGDITPWTRRSRTDILGVFMASHACRMSTSASSSDSESASAEAALGPRWRDATTEQQAVQIFLDQLRPMKTFVGLYLLRKQVPERYAYGIFGLSDSAHGYWLLSDAVAKDAANLKIADQARRGKNLFSDTDREESTEAQLGRLAELARPIIRQEPTLSGEKLAIRMLECGIAVQELFGRYQGKDLTAARNRILGKPARRTQSAKTK